MKESTFDLKLNNYSGPLDLLLKLVKSKKMDLLSIDLYELANAYLEMINKIKEENIDIASEYLVMATSLLNLKGKILLVTNESKAEVEVVKKDLVKQLAEYQQFKILSKKLRENELKRYFLFIKEHEDYSEFQNRVDSSYLDGSSNIEHLTKTLKKMFERNQKNQDNKTATITQEINISPEERCEEIRLLLKNKKTLTFEDIFVVPTLKYFIVTLLSILDMSRLKEIKIIQKEQFGDITIEKGIKYE